MQLLLIAEVLDYHLECIKVYINTINGNDKNVFMKIEFVAVLNNIKETHFSYCDQSQ